MPNFKNAMNIQPVNFTTSVAADLKQMMKEIQALLKTGIFLVPGWSLDLKGIKKDNLKAFWYVLSFNPSSEDLDQINQTDIHQEALKSYNIQKGLSANLIFSVHEGRINGLATDLDPEIFRKLMSLSFKSMVFYKELEFTDYWLPNMNSPANSQFFKVAFSTIAAIHPQMKSTFLNMSIPKLHKNINDSEKADLDKIARSKNKISNKELAFAGAKKRGYKGSLETFKDPLSKLNINFVSEQIIDLLVENKVLLSSDKEPKQKRLVLFVGEGDASNMHEIQKHYPQFECFAIEPHYSFAAVAKSKVGTDRVFEMTLEEFPLSSRKFDKIFIFNYCVTSLASRFMKQLGSLLQDDGEIVIGAPLTDTIYLGGNFSIAENLAKVFGKENVSELPKNYNFTQRLYLAKGPAKANEEKETLATTPLAMKINEINKDYQKQILEEQRIKNQAAFLKLAETINSLDRQHVTPESKVSVTEISMFRVNNVNSLPEITTPAPEVEETSRCTNGS